MSIDLDSQNEYLHYYKENFGKIDALLKLLNDKFSDVVLWGAGLKGCCFLNVCDADHKRIDSVVDMDVKKQGRKLDTGHLVIGMKQLPSSGVILIANKNYYSSICFTLINLGYDVKKLNLLCVDHYIDDIVTLESIKDNSAWKRRKYYD